jgi:hypothetical protein
LVGLERGACRDILVNTTLKCVNTAVTYKKCSNVEVRQVTIGSIITSSCRFQEA